jgi:hypothetical protein
MALAYLVFTDKVKEYNDDTVCIFDNRPPLLACIRGVE